MKITAFLFLVFGLLAIGLGVAMLMDKTLLNQFDSTIRTLFIALLFVYGAYRVWTAISAAKKRANS